MVFSLIPSYRKCERVNAFKLIIKNTALSVLLDKRLAKDKDEILTHTIEHKLGFLLYFLSRQELISNLTIH